MESFDYIFNHMMGYCTDSDVNYPNQFTKDWPCDLLAEEAFSARLRISKQLCGDENGENADVMTIVNAYEQLIRTLCEHAFEYGKAQGAQQQKSH